MGMGTGRGEGGVESCWETGYKAGDEISFLIGEGVKIDCCGNLCLA